MNNEEKLRDSLMVAAIVILGAYAVGTVAEVVTIRTANDTFRLTLAAIAFLLVLLLGSVLWRIHTPADISR